MILYVQCTGAWLQSDWFSWMLLNARDGLVESIKMYLHVQGARKVLNENCAPMAAADTVQRH